MHIREHWLQLLEPDVGAPSVILCGLGDVLDIQVAAGSLVLKPVKPFSMVAGSPAMVVGHFKGNVMPAITMSQEVSSTSVQKSWTMQCD